MEAKESSDKANRLRRADFTPAVLYGSGKETKGIKVKKADLEKAYATAGEATLIDLKIKDGETVTAVFKDVQRDPLKSNIIHADFYRVDMEKKLEVEVPLHFIGEAKAVKELGGTLVKNMESVETRCLPGDLIDKIEVDISGLAAFNDHIAIKDLKVPATVEIMAGPDEIVALAMAPAAQEAEPAPAAAAPAEGETTAPEKGEEAKEAKTEK